MQFIGNLSAVKAMESYCKKENWGNLTFSGPKGVGKFTSAKALACKLVNCSETQLATHPDVYLCDGKEMKVEDITTLLNFSMLMPEKAFKKIVIIDNSNELSEIIQNKLLKVVEEGNTTTFFFVAHQKLLETIESRTFSIVFSKLTASEMEQYFNSIEEIPTLPICMLQGSIGRYNELKEDAVLADTVLCLKSTLENLKNKSELLQVFHVLKEKDKEEFFSSNKKNIDLIIAFLKEVFFNLYMKKKQLHVNAIVDLEALDSVYSLQESASIYEKLQQHYLSCKDARYSKNDFFILIAYMVL
jgi:replication-associated recombination protein RarA